jgi:hypothetical protein
MEKLSIEPPQTWQTTCEEAMKAIVTILMYSPRPFDTEDSGSSEATGFIVDAERGIILTNRVSSKKRCREYTLPNSW